MQPIMVQGDIAPQDFTALGTRIRLDRFAKKDRDRMPQPGDIVLTKEGKDVEVCRVEYVDTDSTLPVVCKAFRTGQVLERRLCQVDLPTELTEDDIWQRVARGAALTEQDFTDFYEAMKDWKFLPAGRVLAGCGTGNGVTLNNCFTLACPEDSRGGIIRQSLGDWMEIMARGGGVGVNMSSLRPRDARVYGVNGRSSGSVSWMGPFSQMVFLTQQAGSRRGAAMVILNDWHPDVLEFIDAKRTPGVLEGCNVSVGFSEEFMAALERGDNWDLRFPPTDHPAYATEWKGNLEAWEAKGYPTVVYETILASYLWNRVVQSAWASAEPGLWFRGRCQARSNAWYDPESEIIATNPCSEIPLPAYGVCNLSHVNLSRMCVGLVGKATLNYDLLGRMVRTGVRFLDNIIDVTMYPLPQIHERQLSERRIGLGTLGLGEALIRCGIRYGSDESVRWINDVYSFIANEAYQESARLSFVRGPFPRFDCEKFLQADLPSRLLPETRAQIRKHGIRNVCLLTAAPTGTVGTLVGTSTGIEPFFGMEWKREGNFGEAVERAGVFDVYREENPNVNGNHPDFFVSALELSPDEHVKVQAACQQWIDQSISKTINAPESWTPEQVGELYRKLYTNGCKGGTVYRQGSRDKQVLSMLDEPAALTGDLLSTVKARPHRRSGETVSEESPAGTVHITMNNVEGVPFEIFAELGKCGSEVKAMAEALGRLCSLVLRLPSTILEVDRVRLMVEQIRGIGGADSVGFGPNRVGSLPDAMAKAMAEHWLEDPGVTITGCDICPSCGRASFIMEGGCQTCRECGFSKCG